MNSQEQFEKESEIEIKEIDRVYLKGKKTKLHTVYYWIKYALWLEKQNKELVKKIESEIMKTQKIINEHKDNNYLVAHMFRNKLNGLEYTLKHLKK